MSERADSFWRTPQELWKKFLTLTPLGILRRAESLRKAPKEVQFSLSHVFIRELIDQFEAFTRLESLDDSLRALGKHQLEVFVREELGMPLHPGYFMEQSRDLWQQGQVSLHDSFYINQESMLERSKKGVEAASNPEQKRRYELETLQIEKLQEELAQQYTAQLTPITPGSLHQQVKQRYPSHEGPIFALGQKLLTTMPKSKVHAGDKAYVSTFQALYLPDMLEYGSSLTDLSECIQNGTYLGKIVTVTDSLFYELSHHDLVATHEQYGPLSLQADEDILMQVVTKLPVEMTSLWGRQVFIDLSQRLVEQGHSPSLARLLSRQQAREQDMFHVRGIIEEGAKFLAHVLLLELARATVNDPEFLDFPTRLYYAFGLVASPLLQRLKDPQNASFYFSYELARENYLQAHPTKPLPELRSGMVIDPALRDHVIRPEFLQKAKKIQLSQAKKRHYQGALEQLPAFYLNHVMGSTLCNAFSFGSFIEGKQFFQLSQVQSALGGATVTSLQDINSIFGNTEGWHLGKCVNPLCPNKDVEQMVGGCNICAHCHLQSELADFNQSSTVTDTEAAESLAPFFQKSYSTLEGVRQDARKLTLSAGLLPYYMLQENILQTGHMGARR